MGAASILVFLLSIYAPCGYYAQDCETAEDYDFVIIGAGTTGLTIANRLTELPDIKVLVLEAGGEPTHTTDIPLITFMELFKKEVDWQYYSVPQETACFAFKEKKVPLFRGKCLGGTSSINFMTYTRGNKHDYDTWASYGNEGWGYADLFPYMMKFEDYRVPASRHDAKYHNLSSGAPLKVEIPPFKSLMAEAFLQAGQEMGEPLVDYNTDVQLGYMYPPVTIHNGERWSSYKAYLKPVMERPNLKVVTGALVTKILFNEEKAAVGVNYEVGDKNCMIKPIREVILSAGTYNSPQILLLSGVGPKDHLESVNIEVVHDLPGVGENMQDHLTIGGMIYMLDEGVGMNSVRYETPEYEQLWEDTRTGPMTVPVSFEGVAFIKTEVTEGPEDWPDLELFFNTDNTARVFKPYLQDYAAAIIPDPKLEACTFHPILLRPKSRGTVRLNSSDPHIAPLIDPKLFSHEDDLEVIVEALILIQKIGETKAFKQHGATLANGGFFSACWYHLLNVFSLRSYFRCYARQLSSTAFHPSSTCKMGPASDKMAVVDSKLKVHGIKNLRIADASIMPNIVAGHPQVACYTIGEKISDDIKAEIAASKKK